MTDNKPDVVAGVDTHADTHWAAVITTTGQHVADMQFEANPQGYARLAKFITSFGRLTRAGVEGTSSYGAGLTQTLLSAGVNVSEVIRPKRAQRRKGKSDPIDAYAAAAAALSGQDLPVVKTPGGDVDAIRALSIARRSAVKAKTETTQQITSILTTAPVHIRERYRHLSGATRIETLARLRPGPATSSVDAAVLTALKTLARRHQMLDEEITVLTADLDALTQKVNPALRAAQGIGPVTAAQILVTAGQNPERLDSQAAFAALAGISPIPASSGKTNRHRLNRGGDRQANAAIHRIVIVRMSHDPKTKAYVARRTTEGKTTSDIIRCLKRAVAREIYGYLTNPGPAPDTTSLKQQRTSKNITLAQAAQQLGCWPSELSRLERGHKHDHQLTKKYQDWLNSQPQPDPQKTNLTI